MELRAGKPVDAEVPSIFRGENYCCIGENAKSHRPTVYHIFCGVLYVLKSGCQWRMLPKEYPKWELCYYYFSLWKKKVSEKNDSVLEKVLKKIGWRGPTKQWSERKNQFYNH